MNCKHWWYHKWGEFGPEEKVKSRSLATGVPEGPVQENIAQKRVCKRCKAVDYRRVLVHDE
jgi:hypothetical protein